jgi:hypothetical protein
LQEEKNLTIDYLIIERLISKKAFVYLSEIRPSRLSSCLSQELALAAGMIGVRGSSATRVLSDLRLEKTTKQVQLRVLQVD